MNWQSNTFEGRRQATRRDHTLRLLPLDLEVQRSHTRHRRIEVALTMLIVLALVVWMVAK